MAPEITVSPPPGPEKNKRGVPKHYQHLRGLGVCVWRLNYFFKHRDLKFVSVVRCVCGSVTAASVHCACSGLHYTETTHSLFSWSR